MSDEFYTAAQNYLRKLCDSEYASGMDAWVRAGRKRSTYRHNPSEYHRKLVTLLGAGDEEGFKALKGLEGYASALKH